MPCSGWRCHAIALPLLCHRSAEPHAFAPHHQSKMPSLTKPYETFEKPGIVLAYDLGPTPIHKGGLIGLNAAGKPAPLTPSAPMRFLGVAVENADIAKKQRFVTLAKLGSFVFGAVGFTPAATDLGKLVYAVSDWEVQLGTTGLTNAIPVGTIVGVESTAANGPGVRVRIDLHTV